MEMGSYATFFDEPIGFIYKPVFLTLCEWILLYKTIADVY